uniref:Uncharacterized protein n=1 Tax=Plectus sambesii TaxID=2011161 RepID=A0A914UJN3_9BILA
MTPWRLLKKLADPTLSAARTDSGGLPVMRDVGRVRGIPASLVMHSCNWILFAAFLLLIADLTQAGIFIPIHGYGKTEKKSGRDEKLNAICEEEFNRINAEIAKISASTELNTSEKANLILELSQDAILEYCSLRQKRSIEMRRK